MEISKKESKYNEITQERRKDLMLILKENGENNKNIGDVFGISRERVRQILTEDIKRKSWKVKYTGKIYLTGRDFAREKIREHFDHTCQKCGKKWKKGMRRFDVHHFSCDPSDSRKYDKDVDFNAVTLLCHKCHLNLPGHREAMSKKHSRARDLTIKTIRTKIR